MGKRRHRFPMTVTTLRPSVRASIRSQTNAYTIEAGVNFPLSPQVRLGLGYRIQSILTDNVPHERAQEQGITLGVRGTF